MGIIDEKSGLAQFEGEGAYQNIHDLLVQNIAVEEAAEAIIEGTFLGSDIAHKDSLDRFVDYVSFKMRTGVPYIINLAYPSMRIEDKEVEARVKELINVHLMPEIVIKILKYMSCNVQNSDTNLHLATLIENESIINAIYHSFVTFRADTAVEDRDAKTLNVKRLQQFPVHTDPRFSSPLDAACRFKYVLEYIALFQDVSHIYTSKHIRMWTSEY